MMKEKLQNQVALFVATALAGMSLVSARGPLAYVIGACVVVTFLFWHPIATLTSLLLVCQELSSDPRYAEGSSLIRFGNTLYFGTVFGVPLLFVVVMFALVAIYLKRQRSAVAEVISTPQRLSAVSLALLVSWCVIVSLTAIPAVTAHQLPSLLSQDLRPFLLLVGGFVLGVTFKYLPGEADAVRRSSGLALGFLVVLAIVVISGGRGMLIAGGNVLVFYDSALAVICSALALAVVIAPVQRFRAALGTAAGIVVLVSFRRNAWAFLAFDVVVLVIVMRYHGRFIARLAATIVAFILIGGSFAPGLFQVAGDRVKAAGDTASGSANETSTNLHISDIEVAINEVKEHALFGVGPRAMQLPGLAVNRPESKLYVHNEFLQIWLRFGFVGFSLLSIFIGSLAWTGLRAIRQSTDTVTLTAGFVAIGLFVPLMTAPFLTTTGRWPVVIGLVTGVLFASNRAVIEVGGLASKPALWSTR